jgi:hypothetical protein
MDAYDFSALCRETAYLLNLEDADALHGSGACVGGEKVGVVYLEDLDDGLTVYVDVGRPQEAHAESEVFRHLLDINLELSAQNGESFAIHRDSGHVLLRSFFNVETLTPQYLADGIRDYVALVQELRAGPLASVVRPVDF